MPSPNQPGSGSTPATGFRSILFEGAGHGEAAGQEQEPDYFGDLNLDQIVGAMTAGREQYALESFFYTPLHQVSAVRYRHDVLRDLQQPDVLEAVERFAQSMRDMRGDLEQAARLHYELQKQSWFLHAVGVYCDAVRSLAEGLVERNLTSRGLQGLHDYLAEHVDSAGFSTLAAETRASQHALSEIRYAVKTNGGRVTVTRYEGEPDYGAEVAETFAKFRQAEVKNFRVRLPDYPEMNHVEAQILDRVAWMFPDVFATRAEFCARHADYVDATVGRFDREVQFYLAYFELIAPLREAGLPFCFPHVSAGSKEIAVDDTFDLALGIKFVAEGRTVVCNDLELSGPERVFVVSGPNNGGKTTFARTFGQLHHIAALGLPIPGSEARLFLPDRIFTHFEKEEDIETLLGKFDDELVRVHEILEQATPASVIVMNESFNSTTLNDALYVGSEVMQRLLHLGCLGVYVTFVDEIASLSEATVSMVSQVEPDNPAERTFKVIRQPADGRAYAWAIAEKYGLSYERLRERIGA